MILGFISRNKFVVHWEKLAGLEDASIQMIQSEVLSTCMMCLAYETSKRVAWRSKEILDTYKDYAHGETTKRSNLPGKQSGTGSIRSSHIVTSGNQGARI